MCACEKNVVSERKCLTVNSKEKDMTVTTIYPCVLFQPPSNFNFLKRFAVLILKKKIALIDHPKFFIVNSKEKGMTIEISLSEELFDMKARYNHCIMQCFETVLGSPGFFFYQ